MNMTISTAVNHLSRHCRGPEPCYIAFIHFHVNFLTTLVNERPWVALPVEVVHTRSHAAS